MLETMVSDVSSFSPQNDHHRSHVSRRRAQPSPDQSRSARSLSIGLSLREDTAPLKSSQKSTNHVFPHNDCIKSVILGPSPWLTTPLMLLLLSFLFFCDAAGINWDLQLGPHDFYRIWWFLADLTWCWSDFVPWKPQFLTTRSSNWAWGHMLHVWNIYQHLPEQNHPVM